MIGLCRPRLLFIFSLLVLGAVLASTIYFLPQGGKLSEVQREQLLHREGEWILELDIVNLEGKDTSFTVTVMLDGREYGDQVLIADGHRYTYIHHIYPELIASGEVSFAIYRESEARPIEQGTYFID